MSHYLVAVFTDGNKTVDELLAPYDESLTIPHYTPKEEFIRKERKRIEDYKNGLYAKYLSDPKKYIESCKNEGHINYIVNEFPKELEWSDEECYKNAVRFKNPEDICDDGSVFGLYNPNGKWDWYKVGGRWSNSIRLMSDTGFATANDADMNEIDFDHPEMKDFTPYAAVTPNGAWHEPARMGWWGISFATDEDDKRWNDEFRRILETAREKNWHITMVDCHI